MIGICFRASGLFALIFLMTLFGYTYADVSPGGGVVDCSYQKANLIACPGVITSLTCYENFFMLKKCGGTYQTDIMVDRFGCTSTNVPTNCVAEFQTINGSNIAVKGFCTKTYECKFNVGNISCYAVDTVFNATKTGLYYTQICEP
jgi:hypothetical protein